MGRRPGSREVRRARSAFFAGSVAALALASCKPRQSTPAPPVSETTTDLANPLPAPVSKARDFAVGDEVSIIDDKGTLEVEGRVTAVTAAPKGYTVRVGFGRMGRDYKLPPERVFPAPWASAARVKVGDVIYELRYGNFPRPRCVVQEVPADVHAAITALCDGETKTRWIKRQDTFYAFEAATLDALSPGEIVYVDKGSWAMVIDKSDAGDRAVLRLKGWAAKDQLTPLSKIERVR